MVRITARGAESGTKAPGAKVEARKREILRAAATVFRAKGLTGARMKDIADELGAAVGNLYYYFKDKQELLAFCQEDGLAGLLALTERVAAQPLGPAERLYLLIVGHVVQVNEATPGALAHLELEGLEPARRERLAAGREGYRNAVRSVIEEGCRGGRFRAVDTKIATQAILGAVNWTVRWFDVTGGKTAFEIGVDVADLLVRGLLAPDTPFSPPALDAARPRFPAEVS